jgi:hypothetical protein
MRGISLKCIDTDEFAKILTKALTCGKIGGPYLHCIKNNRRQHFSLIPLKPKNQ